MNKYAGLDIQDIQGAVGRGWCHPGNAHKIMDPTLALAIADEVSTEVRKYAGLSTIVAYKEAQLAKDVANIGSYFIPGVGTARMGLDSLSGAGKGIASLFKGQGRKALGQFGGSAANALFALASLVPGGGAIGGGARALRAARAVAMRGGKGLVRPGAAMARPGGALGQLASKIPLSNLRRTSAVGNQMSRAGKPYANWRYGLGGMGLMGGGMMLENGMPKLDMPKLDTRYLGGSHPYMRSTTANRYQGLQRAVNRPPPSSVPFGAMPGYRYPL